MDRISGTGFALDGNGHRVFVDQNLAAGVDGTDVVAAWLTAIQEEPLAVIEQGAGLVANAGDNTQLLQAIRAMIALAVATAEANYRPLVPHYFGTSTDIALGAGWYEFTLIGGGGGGAACSQAFEGSGGGASGSEVAGTFLVTAPFTAHFAAGAAGLGGGQGSNAGGNGLQGGPSTFIGFAAMGGGGGNSADNPTASGAGGVFVAGSGQISAGSVPAQVSNVNVVLRAGNDGGDGTGIQGPHNSLSLCLAGNGGASSLGGAGRGGNEGGLPANAAGAGGGGAYSIIPGGFPGGNGGGGVLILRTLAALNPVNS